MRHEICPARLRACGLMLFMRACIQPEIALDALVPRLVVQRPPIDPLFIRHGLTPVEKRLRRGPGDMPELPSPTFDDFANFLRDE